MASFDGHAHLDPRPGGREALLRTMDGLKIAQACVVAGGTIPPALLSRQITLGGGTDVEIANEAVRKACEPSAGRLLPFFFANPMRGAKLYLEEGKAFHGLKLGPAVHGVPLNDPRTRDLAAAAEFHGHPVYLHCLSRPGFMVADLVKLAAGFPWTSFILGHAGVGNCDFYAIEQIERSRNIFFETSGGFSAVIKAACRQLGPERVIFGTEYPLQDPFLETEKIRRLGLEEAALRLVMGGNMDRLLTKKKRRAACA